ncbi:hypothetical protein QAD02_011036 [Eretmocerus hayati]|uniref:Uncharacterized protein n=1 Tax=Eretmocerus hayati TaxID=131215 RepID=A0ACC2NVG0_9HYME|nr:hypothetical protein QAD02_011036 [Eretmocerus hayati]
MLVVFIECAALLLMVSITKTRASTHCEQKWDDIKAPHTAGDVYRVHLMKINMSDEYVSFMPNTQYQVTVKSDEEERTFIRFYLTVENENKSLSHGNLELYDPDVSQFSQLCPNSVVQQSQVPKDAISVYWTSPDEGGGCVIFRVSIMESPSRWFMDGSLEQKFCQDPKASIDDPGPVLPECCACDEAKYELAFEGLWTRYTHPKNFPSKPWNARFSDVIGASHTSEYRFWEYNGLASEGLKQVAENGVTRILESELKNQSEHIRTIIKARGINFPNITSKTFAVFRVDQQHHLMSVVSMIDPSPDWFVGVSGLELCLSNCSWIEQKELNLYPVDAGTDDGVTYEAVDAETDPRDIIRRITTRWPADERSPFYDESAVDMNPMARLYLKRQRIYEKDCERPPVDDSSEGPHTFPPITRKACRVTPWGQWEACSVTCGRGVKLRQRKYKNEKAAAKHNCDSVLTDRVVCYAENNFVCPPDEVDEKKCPLTPWSEWTPCSKSCGPESRTRDRNFARKKKRKECRHLYPHIELQQTLDCENPACEGGSEGETGGGGGGEEESSISPQIDETETVSPEEQEGNPDAAEAKGNGEPAATDDAAEGQDKEAEEGTKEEDRTGSVEAENRRRLGGRGSKARRRKCVDDRYTQWSFWTPCSVTCGTGTKTRSRKIKPEYNGSPDTAKDLNLYECQYESTTCEAETKSCEITKELTQVICSQPEKPGHCPDDHDDNSLRYYYDRSTAKCVVFHYTGCNGNMNNFRTLQECQATCGQFLDCRVTEWSEWSPCYSCRGYRSMSRSVLMHPRNGGKPCPAKLIRRQKCHKVLPECDVPSDPEEAGRESHDRYDDPVEEETVHCRVSPWGPWSTCTASCGRSQRRRIRNVVVFPRGPRAKTCPMLTQIEDCPVPDC